VLVLTVVAPVFGTNCTVVAVGPGAPCVVVDAGAGVSEQVRALIDVHGLRPQAVVATHGHVDHTWDAAGLCAEYDVPFLVHRADAYRIDEPFESLGGVSGALGAALAALGFPPAEYQRPTRVVAFDPGPDGTRLPVEGVDIALLHAPGHTEGSTILLLDGAPDDASAFPPLVLGADVATPSGLALMGDVLFADGIGRVDLAGGDESEMIVTLSTRLGRIADDTLIIPGHGPASTMGRERARNPYLAEF
jgi:hydroxyacylglutathione hydrolase